jgi:hypothetical protein
MFASTENVSFTRRYILESAPKKESTTLALHEAVSSRRKSLATNSHRGLGRRYFCMWLRRLELRLDSVLLSYFQATFAAIAAELLQILVGSNSSFNGLGLGHSLI